MKKIFGAVFFLSLLGCENPKAPSSQFLFSFEKTVRSGSQQEFESKLLVDPRTDGEPLTPQLISDVDGHKENLASSREILRNYLSSRSIDYVKTTKVVPFGFDFSVTASNGKVTKYVLNRFALKNSSGKPVLDIDVWFLRSDANAALNFLVGDIRMYDKFP